MDMKKNSKDFDEQALDDLIQEAMSDDMFVAVPEGFADRMEKKAQQINLYRFWQDEFLKHIYFIGGPILMLAITFGVFYYFNPESLTGILSFLNQFKWLLLGGIILLFGIQLADSWVFKRLGKNQNT
jgi:hypothetical protein